jgi:hypothetical protein
VTSTPNSHQQIDHSNKQKKNQRRNYPLDKMGLTDIYRPFHPTAVEYIFFPTTLRTFSKIGHILSYEEALNK